MAAHVSAEYQRAYKQRLLERAPKIPCGCGCGTLMPAIKSNGTPRRFINGHFSPEHGRACARRARHVRFPKGRKKGTCVDCGGPCTYGAQRCRSCAGPLGFASKGAKNGTSSSALCRYAREHLKDACERCDATEQLEAHHRDKDRFNYSAENIETLCKSCHRKHHLDLDRAASG